mmetsp:Transcript_16087/g.32023  ORF Transcript_16087/g.32023 Transcript_16087/m.32023 type:complete len:115 (+) Transcript_16087:1015-1359(+)
MFPHLFAHLLGSSLFSKSFKSSSLRFSPQSPSRSTLRFSPPSFVNSLVPLSPLFSPRSINLPDQPTTSHDNFPQYLVVPPPHVEKLDRVVRRSAMNALIEFNSCTAMETSVLPK